MRAKFHFETMAGDETSDQKNAPVTRSSGVEGQVLSDVADLQAAVLDLQTSAHHGKKDMNEVKRDVNEVRQQLDQMGTMMNDIKTLLAGLQNPSVGGVPGGAGGNNANSATRSVPSQNVSAAPKRPPDVSGVSKLSANVKLYEFQRWRILWENTSDLIQLKNYPVEQQYSALLSRMNFEVFKILEFKCKVDLQNRAQDPKTVLDKMEAYLKSNEHQVQQSIDFYKRVQQKSETVNEFYVALEELATRADLCKTCRDRTISTQLVGGLREDCIRSEVLSLDPFPELNALVKKCVCEERSLADQRPFKMRGENSIAKVHDHRGQKRGPPHPKKTAQSAKTELKKACEHCGGKSHFQGQCPAAERECGKCKRKGHYAKMCKYTKVGSVSVSTLRAVVEKAPLVRVSVQGAQGNPKMFSALPDTGADVSIVGRRWAEKIGLKRKSLKKTDRFVSSANAALQVIGEASVSVSYNGRRVQLPLLVCMDYDGLILSWDASVKLGIVSYHPDVGVKAVNEKAKPRQEGTQLGKQPGESRAKVVPSDPTPEEVEACRRELLEEFKDVFSSDDDTVLKTQKCPPLKIKLREDAQPFCQVSARPVPLARREGTKASLDDMDKKKIIAKEEKPTPWCHPMVPVVKKDGSIRVCVDLKKLNEAAARPHYPQRTPKDAVSSVPANMKYFSTLDAKHGYWQVELDEESQALTTFITPWGRYKFLRAPMGFVGTGDYYNCETDKPFAGRQDMVKIVDDISTYHASFPEHYAKVR